MAEIKGTALKSTLLLVRERLGELGIERLGAELSPEVREAVAHGILVGTFYPVPWLIEIQDAAARVRHALAKLRRVLAEPHGEVLDDADLAARVDELARRAVRLVGNGEEVARYLGREDPAAVQREIDRLEAKARDAGDPATGKQWSEAAQAQREHRKVLADLAAAQDRVLASLSGIAASLDELSAKVVRMGALDAQQQSELSGDVSSELSRLNSEVNAFEETLRPLMPGRVSA